MPVQRSAAVGSLSVPPKNHPVTRVMDFFKRHGEVGGGARHEDDGAFEGYLNGNLEKPGKGRLTLAGKGRLDADGMATEVNLSSQWRLGERLSTEWEGKHNMQFVDGIRKEGLSLKGALRHQTGVEASYTQEDHDARASLSYKQDGVDVEVTRTWRDGRSSVEGKFRFWV